MCLKESEASIVLLSETARYAERGIMPAFFLLYFSRVRTVF